MKSDPAATALGGLIIWGGLLFVIFLAIRVFWLWYFKLDRIAALLENIDDNLAILREDYEKKTPEPPSPPTPPAPRK